MNPYAGKICQQTEAVINLTVTRGLISGEPLFRELKAGSTV